MPLGGLKRKSGLPWLGHAFLEVGTGTAQLLARGQVGAGFGENLLRAIGIFQPDGVDADIWGGRARDFHGSI